MRIMFGSCISLTILDLSNFNTSLVQDMGWMFYQCRNLTSLNLSSFTKSNTTTLDYMFAECISLVSLDLNKLDTSKVTNINYMFSRCHSLTSLDLSNFIFSKVIDMAGTFYDCPNLKYINLKNMIINDDTKFDYFIDTRIINPTICIDDEVSFYKIYSIYENLFINYSSNLIENSININKNYKIIKPNYGLLLYNSGSEKCYQIYSYYYYYDENVNKYFCTEKFECPKNYNKLILDKNECVNSCDKDPVNKYDFKNICYQECPPEISKLKDNKTCEVVCSEENPFEIIKTQECVNYCTMFDIMNKNCILNYKASNEGQNNTEEKVDIGKQIISEILNGNLNEVIDDIITNGNSVTFEDGKDKHQISVLSKNFEEDNKNNYTSVYFGDCEELLKDKYNIKGEELIIYQIEHYVEGINIPILEYVLFTQNGSINLDLSVCNNVSVKYKIPVSIEEEELYKHDPNDDYYNDECNKQSSEDVDMTLYERKNNFNNKNYSLCESNCKFIDYNKTTSKAICDCKIKNDMSYSNDNTANLLSKIDNEKSSSNLAVTQCIKEFVKPENIKSNGGFYSMLIILIIFIIVFIIFCLRGKSMIENKIDDVIYKQFVKNKNKKPNNSILNQIRPINTLKRRETKISSNKKNKKNVTSKNILSNKKGNNILSTDKSKKKVNKKNNLINLKNNTKMNNTIHKSEEKIEYKPDKDNDYEFNNLSYRDAIKYDKRTFCDYYMTLIKNKQIFAFTFCSFSDYNSGIIRKFIFFLSFALHYSINTLFFNDINMHQIYEDEGKYNFSYQLPKILISALCSTIILRLMLEFLILTDKSILKVKLQPNQQAAKMMKKEVLKCVNIKFAIFFILNFILLILFWIYLTCWNGKYENTQVYLIENTVISFAFSLFYPFVINIIPSAARMSSLDTKSADKECMYNFSKLAQII